MSVPKKIRERFETALKVLRPILQQQRDRDVSEADTVTLVRDVLSEVLGFDKFADVTASTRSGVPSWTSPYASETRSSA